MTLPNKLTVLRLALTFLIMALLFIPGVFAKGLCLLLFLIACATDWLDGYLARRWNQISPFGILMDPIADKVLVIGLMLAFVQLELVRAWMVLVIFVRELLITGVRLYAVSRHIVIPAATEGKHKLVSQLLAILIVLALLFARELFAGETASAFEAWMRLAILWAMWVAVVLTVVSGASFFWWNRSVLRDAASR